VQVADTENSDLSAANASQSRKCCRGIDSATLVARPSSHHTGDERESTYAPRATHPLQTASR
jgi:hypothetical protein